ncbi:DUF3810 domain-containing protein [Caminicella sporogenes]|uniref:DUF3810 domain-containing protein n=1 Tax=Caminicella sporogenes TaxID=166485 RepID=UPI0025416281|nr:DUF3810 domain-containing protein [Caminicella sporogenes]WIF94897.1 DUF3810 domain-containing protein [Caminicella sporogenes]
MIPFLNRLSYLKLIFIFSITLFTTYISSIFPSLVEILYSNFIYKFIGQVLSIITSFIPFSLAEFLVISIFLYTLIYLINTITKIIKKSIKFQTAILLILKNFLAFTVIIYFFFIFLWGLNYYRLPFSQIVNLNTSPASIDELENLCKNLIQHGNQLRNYIKEDSVGIMTISGGYKSVFKRADLGYQNIGQTIKIFNGKYGKPKKILFSNFLSYAGISGIYFPFTSETNINILQPHSMLPSTVCHEMAHQRGFAREDEANYIAYLVCIKHPDIDFQYSGILLAIIHSMNALYMHDKKKYFELEKLYCDGMKRDLCAIRNFWISHEGPIEKISNKINDTYLKLNHQKEGVYSYGKMVDLLIAEYKLKNNLNFN